MTRVKRNDYPVGEIKTDLYLFSIYGRHMSLDGDEDDSWIIRPNNTIKDVLRHLLKELDGNGDDLVYLASEVANNI